METNGLPVGMFPGILGLEIPLHPQPQQQPQNPQTLHHHHHQNPQMVSYSHHETDDDDQVGFTLDVDDNGKRKVSSPWHRMKWTDNMIRLLIMAVYYIGDDQAGPESGGIINDSGGNKKLLQKKGKWKSVSRAMMEKGFYVSPQQCEDKFNDLNKRYKRVNEILGKGTACKVVENQGLLDSMDNLSPKMKKEVKKLLNSKHLFFREMCAYHNSCGHGTSTESTSQIHHHSLDKVRTGGDLGRTDIEGSKLGKVGGEEEEEDDDDDDDNEGDDESDDDHDGDDENEEKSSQLRSELGNVMKDGSKSYWEKKHWMKLRVMQLEEEQVKYQRRAFELEKQRLKWIKFSGKKEREMEKEKLENDRRRLENERMMLIVRRKELELLEMVDGQHHNQTQQHSSNRRGDPSSITGSG